jgi:hypothetical protein
MTEITKQRKLTLKVPVTFEGGERTEIMLRRIKGKDIRDLDREPEGSAQTFFLIGRLSGWPPEGVDELDAEDIEAISRVVEGFTGKRTRR